MNQGISAKLISELASLAEAAEEDNIRPPSLLVMLELTKLCMMLDFPPEWMKIMPRDNGMEFYFELKNNDRKDTPSFILQINQFGEFAMAAEASMNSRGMVGTDLESIVMAVERLR